MELIDSHLHLQDARIIDQVPALLARARSREVAWFLCNGTCPSDWPMVLALARQHAGVVPALGLHPWYVSVAPDAWHSELIQSLRDKRVQIGEIGLDRHFVDSGYARQEEVFREQLVLAGEWDRFAMVHCVKAWDRLVKILGDLALAQQRVIVHSFGESEEVMRQLLDRGVMFSFSPSVVSPSRERLREVLRRVPLDRLLLETDTPELFQPQLLTREDRDIGLCRDRLNEPAMVASLYAFVAELRNLEVSELAESIRQNAAPILTT